MEHDPAELLERNRREHTPPDQVARSVNDERSPGQRDRDRILYSPEFRRLAGITQVISPSGSHPTHNRLTHSLEVAQIARAVATHVEKEYGGNTALIEQAGGLDIDVVEAASLAHDIGHPPFGHVTETTLNKLIRQTDIDDVDDGFEGNAQSFRILTRLAVRVEDYGGLDLTRATLSAVSKYPWTRSSSGKRREKWGFYSTDMESAAFSRAHLVDLKSGSDFDIRTLEARIMDWADDVAYAVHDVEDFFRVGMIPLDRIRSDEIEQERFVRYHLRRVNRHIRDEQERQTAIEAQTQKVEEVAQELFEDIMPFVNSFSGKRADRATIRKFSSAFVDGYIGSVSLVSTANPPYWDLEINEEAKITAALLKSLAWMYVIESEALISLRYGYAAVVEHLFHGLSKAIRNPSTRRMFPEFYYPEFSIGEDQELYQNYDDYVYRFTADFIASLTESQLVDLYHRITGVSFGSSLNRIIT